MARGYALGWGKGFVNGLAGFGESLVDGARCNPFSIRCNLKRIGRTVVGLGESTANQFEVARDCAHRLDADCTSRVGNIQGGIAAQLLETELLGQAIKGIPEPGAGGGVPPYGGAYSRIPAVGEKPGGIRGQINSAACGVACAEALTGTPQETLIEQAGAPTHPVRLAETMGPDWAPGLVETPPRRGGWIAALYQRDWPLMHFVVVDSVTDAWVTVRDPWNGGSTYQIRMKEFNKYFTGMGIFPASW